MIIIEGLDATGKSTLAQEISDNTGWPIQPSEGPEKHPGEIHERVNRYIKLPDHTIYDRHPIISQCIYSQLNNTTKIPAPMLQWLIEQKPLIILASERNHGEHIAKEHDTPEHLDMIFKKRTELAKAYREFFQVSLPQNYLIYEWQFKDAIVKYATKFAEYRSK